ncbi:hypothetical protein BMJ26_00255 [Sinorhizobium medicae]|nr:hypothetical protein BMJ31_24980 [Sinorhizobium medicae]PLU46635.1 hypothetical protein BMJ26_00255 [Sinorhizobium medicae]PLU59763.1 hypothetical protein BMJ24_13575 [Sinorhizobium medicae]PLU64750.1 hypothetical protein BMJ20_33905 [Sinorhizobium medicae]
MRQPSGKDGRVSYEWDGKRAHRKSMIRFLAALAVPAILLSSAIAVAEWARAPTATAAAATERPAARP